MPASSGEMITSVKPLTATFDFERDPLSYCFVRIETDGGLVGYGESCDSYGCTFANVLATVIDDALAPLLVGQELDSVERLSERMRLFTRRRLGDACLGPEARSACEIARVCTTGSDFLCAQCPCGFTITGNFVPAGASGTYTSAVTGNPGRLSYTSFST